MSSELSPPPATNEVSTFQRGWNQLRSNKTAFFALAGFLGGFVGDLVTEPFAGREGAAKGFSAVLARTGFWVAGMVAVLSPSLAFAAAHYNRRQLSVGGAIKMTVWGALGGGLSGALIQAFYSAGFLLGLEHKSATAELFRCAAWGLMGGMVGGLLARSVPNLARWRAVCAGLVGGAIGCGGFLMVGAVLSDMPGRLLGVGVMGLAIGLSIVVAEKLAREASLEIIWAPNEITHANLGERPVFIGGGKEDDVFVRGYPTRHAGITLKQGRVEYLEGASGRQAALKNGSRMEIGKLTVVVHTDAPEVPTTVRTKRLPPEENPTLQAALPENPLPRRQGNQTLVIIAVGGALAIVMIVLYVLSGLRADAAKQAAVTAEHRAKEDAVKVAAIEAAKQEADRAKEKAEAEEKANAVAKAVADAKTEAIAQAAAQAAAAAKLELERKAKADADKLVKLKSNPTVLALWSEPDQDAIKINSTTENGAYIRHNGKTLSVKYSDMPEWLKTKAQAMHKEDGEAKGFYREVRGKIYDLRTNPPGWVTIGSAQVIQIFGDGYLLRNEDTSTKYTGSL